LLGIVIYFLLSLRILYRGAQPEDIPPEIVQEPVPVAVPEDLR
jgi:hypothetical protein